MSDILLTEIRHRLLDERNISLRLLREDLNHPLVGGNKWRKLKYNLEQIASATTKGVVSMGGVYSNHLYALAALAQERGQSFLALVRENDVKQNPSLDFVRSQGAEVQFIDRSTFRAFRNEQSLVASAYPNYAFIPEGGSNSLALQGCEEIGALIPSETNVVCVAVGTGYTMAGIVNSVAASTAVIGFPALKEQYLDKEIESLLKHVDASNWRLERSYHLGGIGAYNDEFIEFLNRFYTENHLRLDPIYNGKVLFGLFQMISNDSFEEGANIVVVLTGGEQGIAGFNHRYGPLLAY